MEVWGGGGGFLGMIVLYYIVRVFLWCRGVDFRMDLRCLEYGSDNSGEFWVFFTLLVHYVVL